MADYLLCGTTHNMVHSGSERISQEIKFSRFLSETFSCFSPSLNDYREQIFSLSIQLLNCVQQSSARLAVLFKGTSVGWCLLAKWLKSGPSSPQAEGQALSAHSATLSVPSKKCKGKATTWKAIPVPTADRERASVANMYLSSLWSTRQMPSHLSCCRFLRLGLGKEMQIVSLLETAMAIQFHFKMTHAKVSINPNQRWCMVNSHYGLIRWRGACGCAYCVFNQKTSCKRANENKRRANKAKQAEQAVIIAFLSGGQ